MKIDIRFQGDLVAREALRAHAVHRALFRFSRFAGEVESVAISFSDINGPKGGIDSRCRIRIRGARLGTVNVESLGGDPYSAVAEALERAQRAVHRQLERRREGVAAAQRRAS